MIQMKIGDMSSHALQMALQKLVSQQVNPKAAYAFKKMNDKFNQAMKEIRDAYTKEVVKVFGEFDEKGNLVPDKNAWGFKLKEGVNQEEFDKANETFHNRVVTLDREPIPHTYLQEIRISAAELSALQHLLTDPEAEPEPSQMEMNIAQLRR